MTVPEPGTFAAIVALGGLVALDGTSVAQTMASRPIVAATLAGWVAGAPAAGALMGLILEAFHLTVLPVGAARYPEGGPSAVVAGAAAALVGTAWWTVLSLVVFALLWETVSGATVQRLRQVNSRLAAVAPVDGIAPGSVERRHLLALALDLVRGLLLTVAGLPLALLALHVGEVAADVPAPLLRAGLAGTAAMAVAGSLQLFGRKRRTLFAAGAAGGLLVLLLA